MKVEIIYLDVSFIFHESTIVQTGATVRDALQAVDFLTHHPASCLEDLMIGIYSKRVGLDHRLLDGDRIEIYRTLTIDPKQRRKRRARASSGSS